MFIVKHFSQTDTIQEPQQVTHHTFEDTLLQQKFSSMRLLSCMVTHHTFENTLLQLPRSQSQLRNRKGHTPHF